jgi:hypothetical protein
MLLNSTSTSGRVRNVQYIVHTLFSVYDLLHSMEQQGTHSPKTETRKFYTGPVSAPIDISSMGWNRLVPANPLILLGLTVRLWGFTQP